MDEPVEDGENNPFLVTRTQENNQMTDKYFDLKNPMEWDIVGFHRFFIEKNKDRPEKLDYKTAADKLTRSLRDIVSTSANADMIRQALNLQEKAKVSVDFSCTYVMLQLDRSSLRPWSYQRFSWFGSLQLRGNSADRARRKGGPLDKMWVSVEVELKEKKLTDLQLHGLLQATQEIPGLKSLISNLEVQHEDIAKEIKGHSCDQVKLVSLPASLVTWLRFVLASTVDEFDEKVNMQLKDANEYENDLRIVFRGTLIDFHTMIRRAKSHTIERHASERKFILEQVSIPFKYIEYVFELVTFNWVEKNMMMTKALQFVEDPDKKMTTYKVDALAIVKENRREFATIEVSGGPIEQDRPHTLGDTKKTLLEGCEMLQGTLQQYLDASLDAAKKPKFYTMQVIVDRIVLVEISVHESGFKAVEVRSARWPFSWNSVAEYMHIFELIAYFMKNLRDQEKVINVMASEHRGIIEVKSITVRQWLKSVQDTLNNNSAI
ncbi:9730_t:CDS:10 [Acaulospora morrowiae]|uniref:9730_t:CDS:1 n=1 Tax=Acaulospora morrowiae TaxID=94023 RepID=A0A9N9DIV6_9GLOM|nr:9730_t:CDS:10 [Acaulospora morrowiae]